jgi:hypothetical protein
MPVIIMPNTSSGIFITAITASPFLTTRISPRKAPSGSGDFYSIVNSYLVSGKLIAASKSLYDTTPASTCLNSFRALSCHTHLSSGL